MLKVAGRVEAFVIDELVTKSGGITTDAGQMPLAARHEGWVTAEE